MRTAFVLAVLYCIVAAATAVDYRTMWGEFKTKYAKEYATKAEEVKRYNHFIDNMKKAAIFQSSNPHATFGASPYADMSAEEFKRYHNAGKHYAAAKANRGPEVGFSAAENRVAAGKSIDWRTKGAVTHVKNQQQCGSCWSFSTTGGIEGQWFLAGNTLTSLSEQELVSCDTIDDGCSGGLMQNAFKWLMENKDGKIVTAASYPYVSGDGNVPACDLSGTVFGAQIDGHVDVKKHESDMATWVYANGPLSIAVDASSWQTYSGGIMTNCVSQQVDHGVLIVGFDDNNSPPYWIIKNSWGPSWGEAGYIRVEKGTDQCLITDDPTSSIVKKAGPPSPTTGSPAGPTPPTPTGTPTPGDTWEQLHCTDPNCKNCQTHVRPQGKCINGGTFGYKATCAVDALIVETFASTDCSGTGTVTSEPINVCEINVGKNGLNSFIMNKCSGSGPVPPSPPSPPSPPTPPNPPVPTNAPMTPPSPSGATFTQKVCSDSACSQGCTSNTLPQNQCLKLASGGSATANCSSSELNMLEYPFSSDCSGYSVPTTQPLNTCEQDTSGTYFENICSTGVHAARKGNILHQSAVLDRKLRNGQKRL